MSDRLHLLKKVIVLELILLFRSVFISPDNIFIT